MKDGVEKKVAVFVKEQRKELERDENEQVTPWGAPVKTQNPLEPEVAGHSDNQKDDKRDLADAQEKK